MTNAEFTRQLARSLGKTTPAYAAALKNRHPLDPMLHALDFETNPPEIRFLGHFGRFSFPWIIVRFDEETFERLKDWYQSLNGCELQSLKFSEFDFTGSKFITHS